MSASNKDVVRHFYAAVDRRDFDAASSCLAPTFTARIGDNAPITSRDEFMRLLKMCYTAFPDAHQMIAAVLAEGDLVASYGVFTGTHTEGLFGIGPTNRQVSLHVFHFDYVADGAIVQHVGSVDSLTLLRQIGLLNLGAAGYGLALPGGPPAQ